MNYINFSQGIRRQKSIFFVSLIFVAFTLLCFGIYWANTLQGDINYHMLSSETFGIPQQLQEKGLKALYKAPDSGWDGQFYYYMANDIFAQKDTAQHIDAPSYRYQRVGLSLYTAIIAKILGQDWVSPALFFSCYFLLILSATWVGSRLFQSFKGSPYLILFWSLSVGTQVTLFNALPDAAADAFLILGLAAVLRKYYALSVIPFAFSALSREVYAFFPSCILGWWVVSEFFSHRKNLRSCLSFFGSFHAEYCLIVPGLIAVVWHFWVTYHFGIEASQQAHGVLGWPLRAWLEYWLSGIKGHHKLVPAGLFSYAEAVGLLFFLGLLISAFRLCYSVVTKRALFSSVTLEGFSLALLVLTLLYASFGHTVMLHYTGYFKASAIFFFALPLLITQGKMKGKDVRFIYGLLIIASIFITLYNFKVRILHKPDNLDQYTHMSQVTETQKIECFGEYHAKVQIENIRVMSAHWLGKLFNDQDFLIIDISLTNTSQYEFRSTRNVGGVYMSYHWLDTAGKVVGDGIRSALPGGILPEKTGKVSVVAPMPSQNQLINLKLSPVQEGCAWFYQANPQEI